MKIVNATESDVDDIASLHLEVFQGFFLSSLGKQFLAELYRGFCRDKSRGVLLVAKHEGKLLAFVAGAYDPAAFFKQLRREKWLAFLIRVLPSVICNPLPVVKKLYSALFYRGATQGAQIQIDSALLSSIGVHHACRGQGLSRRIVLEFESKVQKMGAKLVYLTTDAKDNARAKGFYEKCGYREESVFVQSGERSMIRYEKLLIQLEAGEDL